MEGLKGIVPQAVKNIYHLFQAAVATVIYGFPSRKIKIIGVTGTDGKTTTVSLLYHILKSAGYKVSMISTVNAIVGEARFDTGFHVTTPSPFEIQKFLRMMVKAGSEYAVLEITSHSLDQNRVAFVNFAEAIITNVTNEHLDYHGSYDKYLLSKAKILNAVKYRILNADDESFKKLSSLGSGKMLSVGTKEGVDFLAKDVKSTQNRLDFNIQTKYKDVETQSVSVSTPLRGEFNVQNILLAVACAKTLDVVDKEITKALKDFPGVEGRMENIDEGQKFQVIVDFAHTPNSLEKALKSLKNITRNKLICVFGSAGERDVGKRPEMGRVAAEGCDITILTGEDPRHESVGAIINQIAFGVEQKGGVLNQNYWKIPDRSRAIEKAIGLLANDGDTVAIFGKGHEKSMSIDGVEYPWSDQMAARNSLQVRLNK